MIDFSVRFLIGGDVPRNSYLSGTEAVEVRKRLGLPEGNVLRLEKVGGDMITRGVVSVSALQARAIREFDKENCPTFIIKSMDIDLLNEGDVEERPVFGEHRDPTDSSRGYFMTADVIFVKGSMSPQRAVELIWAIKFREQERKLKALEKNIEAVQDSLCKTENLRRAQIESGANERVRLEKRIEILEGVVENAISGIHGSRRFVKSRLLAQLREQLESALLAAG